jgi:putative FmdB family regulatory protein
MPDFPLPGNGKAEGYQLEAAFRTIDAGRPMPAYEYQCEACSCHFEQRQKMSDAAIENCPACGGHVKRLISGGAGAITKGSSHHADAPPCANGGPCRGMGGGCSPGSFCEN